MKTLFLPALLSVALSAGLVACSGNATTDERTPTADTGMADADTMGGMDANAPMAATTDTAPHATDEEFMMSAAHSDQNEIQLSQLVLDKGVTGMTRDHANQMITDHTKSTNDLKAVAAKKNVTLPTDMDDEHKAIRTEMEKLSGQELEQRYNQQMMMDHQKTVNTMQARQTETQDADVKGFIDKTLPVVQQHLAMFQQHASM